MKTPNSSILTPNALKEHIYRNYYDKVYGYIISKINNPHDAEDIAADVFIKIYENIDLFDSNKGSLSTWIYTVTRNKLTDHFRTRKVFIQIPDTLEDDTSAEDELCNAEALENLADVLETLDKRERDIIVLHFYFGKTLKEIAEELNISYAYIKILKNKTLKKLKKNMENK